MSNSKPPCYLIKIVEKYFNIAALSGSIILNLFVQEMKTVQSEGRFLVYLFVW